MRPWDYDGRVQALAEWAPAAGAWRSLTAADVAVILEALGVPPDGFERVLNLTRQVTPTYSPAALADVCDGYRIGVAALDEVGRFSGRPVGVYLGCAILVWPKTQRQMEWRG